MDLVIADEPLPHRLAVKAYNHVLGSSTMSFFSAPKLARSLQGPFPDCLNGAPMLIPGAQSTVRSQFESWLTLHALHPRVVGEFDDGALMKAFGREGRGVFISPSVVEQQTCAQYDVQIIGRSSDLVEQFYAISAERRISHPGVAAITQAARTALF
jgi:LysR family transcriptional activator of nhaA